MTNLNDVCINPFEGGVIRVTYPKHSGAKGEDVEYEGRSRPVVAAMNGTIVAVGGTYNETVLRPDNGSTDIRICENAVVHVKVGQHVLYGQLIAEGALFRKGDVFPNGAYRYAHINRQTRAGVRSQFTTTVTHSKAAAAALFAASQPKPLTPTQRRAGASNPRRRLRPGVVEAIGAAPLIAGSIAEVEGWAWGDKYLGLPWFRIGGLWSHSSTFGDSGTHDLADLNEVLPPDPVPMPDPPVVVVPPIVEPEPEPPVEPTPEPEPPVIELEPEPVPEPPVDPVEPPVVTPPVIDEPTDPGKPKSTIAAIIAGVILGLIAIGSAIAALFH